MIQFQYIYYFICTKLIQKQQRIHDLFKKKFFYKKDALISEINIVKNYIIENKLFKNANEFLEFLNNNNCGEFFSLWIK